MPSTRGRHEGCAFLDGLHRRRPVHEFVCLSRGDAMTDTQTPTLDDLREDVEYEAELRARAANASKRDDYATWPWPAFDIALAKYAAAARPEGDVARVD